MVVDLFSGNSVLGFDLETTGIDVSRSRIVEYALIGSNAEGEELRVHSLVNPSIPIPAGARAVHGIRDRDVSRLPTFRAHLDGNYDDGFYANYNDPQTGVRQPKGDGAFVVNGRLALTDIRLNGTGATLGVSIWARNLFNEQHLFFRALSPLLGTYGFFNEARTLGAEVNVRF